MISASDILRGTTEQKVGNALVIVGFSLAALTLAVWAIREWRIRKRPDLAILLMGSLPATLSDAGARLMAALQTAPATDHPVYYRAFGITISPYMAAAFPVYIAIAGYMTIRAMQDRWPRRRFWKRIAVLYVLEFGFEQLAINAFQLYRYSHNQPYKIFGLPPAWPAAFIMAGVLTGALMLLLGRNLRGPYRLLLLPIPAGAYAGAFGFATWPLATAVHSTTNKLTVELVSLTTICMMMIYVYLLATFLPQTEKAPRTAPADDAKSGTV
jgi:hypothetical protein